MSNALNEAYNRALEFYAVKGNWQLEFVSYTEGHRKSNVEKDKGKKAQQALTNKGEEDGAI